MMRAMVLGEPRGGWGRRMNAVLIAGHTSSHTEIQIVPDARRLE